MACLGMAETDPASDAVNAPQNWGRGSPEWAVYKHEPADAARLALVCTFTAGGLQVSVEDGRVSILRERDAGSSFVHQVEHITFSGELAVETGQPVLYVTGASLVFRRGPGAA